MVFWIRHVPVSKTCPIYARVPQSYPICLVAWQKELWHLVAESVQNDNGYFVKIAAILLVSLRVLSPLVDGRKVQNLFCECKGSLMH